MHFILFFQATQNRDGVFDCWFIDQHFLKAALECGVFLDILAVFIKRGRTNAMQLTTRQRRLEHIASIQRTFGFPCADHGVNFIDKENNVTFRLGDII